MSKCWSLLWQRVRRSAAFSASALLLSLSPACIDSFEPDVGAPLFSLCSDEDSDPDKDVSFSQDIVPAIFEPDTLGCLQCHDPDDGTPIGFETSGLDLSSYDSMRSGGDISGTDIIIPGRPCDSLLMLKVGNAPPVGARMPLSGPPFLSDNDMQLLHDWIAEGAKNN